MRLLFSLGWSERDLERPLLERGICNWIGLSTLGAPGDVSVMGAVRNLSFLPGPIRMYSDFADKDAK